MGLFGDLFGAGTPEEKAKRDFPKMEERVWKWPCHDYMDVLGVYLSGSFGIEKPSPRGNYCIGSRIDLPERRDPEKALKLLRAIHDPANIKAAKAKFRLDGDPSYRVRYILALVTPDEAERERLFREVCFGNYPYRKEVAWYIHSRGLMDTCCRTVEERAEIYHILMEKPQFDEYSSIVEREPSYDSGVEAWRWHEIFREKKEAELEAVGRAGLAAMLRSGDPETAEKTRAFLAAKDAKLAKRFLELVKEERALDTYAQDVLGMQLVNKKGERVEIRDGVVRKQS